MDHMSFRPEAQVEVMTIDRNWEVEGFILAIIVGAHRFGSSTVLSCAASDT